MRYIVLIVLGILVILNGIAIEGAQAASASCYGMNYQDGVDTHDTMQKAYDSLNSIGYSRSQYYDRYSDS